MTVFSQEPHPQQFDIGDVKMVRPDIDGPLPVFVLDHYDGQDAHLVQDFTPAQRDHYVQRNAAALREYLPADLVLTNHVLMAPVGAASGARYAVKAQGSELVTMVALWSQIVQKVPMTCLHPACCIAAATFIASSRFVTPPVAVLQADKNASRHRCVQGGHDR